MNNLSFKTIYLWPLPLRIVSLLALSFILLCIAYFFDISNLLQQLKNNKQKEIDLKQQLVSTLHKEADLQKQTRYTTYYQNELRQLQNKIITYSKLPDVLNEILKIGSTNHIQFSTFNPDKEIKSELYYKVPIKVIAIGSYHQLASFISQVTMMPWLVVVNEFTISNANKEDVLGEKLAKKAAEGNLLTAEMVFEVYYHVQKNIK